MNQRKDHQCQFGLRLAIIVGSIVFLVCALWILGVPVNWHQNYQEGCHLKAPQEAKDGEDEVSFAIFQKKPLYPFTPSVSGVDYVKSSRLFSLDDDGILVTDYGVSYNGSGKRYNPTFVQLMLLHFIGII